MVTRVLPRKHYHLLQGTYAWPLVPLLPKEAKVIVVKEHDAIVGCWILFPVMHADGLWVSPAHRGGVIIRRLLRRAYEETAKRGGKTLATASMSDQVTDLLTRIGARQLPGLHFTLTVPPRENPTCPSP